MFTCTSFKQIWLYWLMSDVQRRWHQLKILCRASLWKCLWAAAAVCQVSGTQFYGSILHLLHQRVQKKLDSIKCLILWARYCRGILPNCGPRHLTSPACPHPISALNYQHYPHNCSTIEFVNDVKLVFCGTRLTMGGWIFRCNILSFPFIRHKHKNVNQN